MLGWKQATSCPLDVNELPLFFLLGAKKGPEGRHLWLGLSVAARIRISLSEKPGTVDYSLVFSWPIPFFKNPQQCFDTFCWGGGGSMELASHKGSHMCVCGRKASSGHQTPT